MRHRSVMAQSTENRHFIKGAKGVVCGFTWRYGVFVPVLICGLLTIVGGCKPDGPERVVVSGAVTYKGQPLPKGTICFAPCDGTTGASSMEGVIDGQYKIETSGGLPVGVYKVSIRAYRKIQVPRRNNTNSMAPEVEQEQYIPLKYNNQTELKLTIPSGSNNFTHNFDLND